MKTHKYINYHKAFIWIYVGSFITLVLSLFNNPTLLSSAEEITQRAGGNLAFNSIAFGHLGTTGVIMSLFILSKYEKMSIVTKVLVIGIMLLSFFVMLRAGSRSPIVALFVVLIFWLFARGKNIVLGTTVSLIALFLIVIFMDQILGFIGDISPVMEFRLRASIYEGDSSGRDPIFETAFQAFLDKPILGKQFAMFDNGDFGYSHNLILDSLMGLGIFGGLAIVYILWIAIKKSYYFVKNKDSNYWISLILIQQIVLSMLSGAIYYSQLINVLLVFVFISNYSKTQTLFSNQ
jgi:O-antigen ligase